MYQRATNCHMLAASPVCFAAPSPFQSISSGWSWAVQIYRNAPRIPWLWLPHVVHVRNVSVLTVQCILCQEQGSQDGGGEAGKAKSQSLCGGIVSMWSCPLEWWDQLPLQLQEQLEEQSPGFGSTQGTEVARKGVEMRSRMRGAASQGFLPGCLC